MTSKCPEIFPFLLSKVYCFQMMVFLWGKSWQNSKNVRYRNFLVKPLVDKCPLENNATYGDRAKRPQGPIIVYLHRLGSKPL